MYPALFQATRSIPDRGSARSMPGTSSWQTHSLQGSASSDHDALMAFGIADTATLLTASAFCTLHFQMVATQCCPFHYLLLLTVALCALVTAMLTAHFRARNWRVKNQGSLGCLSTQRDCSLPLRRSGPRAWDMTMAALGSGACH